MATERNERKRKGRVEERRMNGDDGDGAGEGKRTIRQMEAFPELS